MFRPNVNCFIRKPVGTDRQGQLTMGNAVSARCGVVKLAVGSEKTSVRTDSSASGGHADEIAADARILFRHDVSVAVDDMIEIFNYKLRVMSVFPRHDVTGRFDHYQVDAMVWS